MMTKNELSGGAKPSRRLSNMELLRIVAMLMVVVIHECFYVFGPPTRAELLAAPGPMLGRIGVQSATVVCVDLFVLLSGYFGIRASWRRLGSLLFQVLFFIVPVIAIYCILGDYKIISGGVASSTWAAGLCALT